MDEIDLKEVSDPNGEATITVIGVGGGGNNMIGHLIRSEAYRAVDNVKLVVANTDEKHMQLNPAKHKIPLGIKSANGLGAGMKPEVAKKAAEESEDLIREAIKGSDIVIISAGLGGGTGTGASPVIARIAKEMGTLTVAVVTKPFKFEGPKRTLLAEEGLEELKEHVDSIVLIPNEKLLNIIDKKTGYKESMSYVDNMLAYAVKSICNIILNGTNTGINVDFADVKTVMSYKGLSLVSMGEATGQDAATNAIRTAIESPLFDNISVSNFKGLIVNFEINDNFSFQEISNAMDAITSMGSRNAEVILGTMINPDMNPDSVVVSVIVTGFDECGIQTQKPSVSVMSVQDSKDSTALDVQKEKHSIDLGNVLRRVSSGDFKDSDLEEPAYTRYSKD